ncbi:hypothetical protein BH10PSE19_BH10PSE19_09940 [soil metagenome]
MKFIFGWLRTYYPVLLIVSYLTAVTLIANTENTGINWHGFMQQFMAGFFLVFSAFKLLDIKGFANAYARYDLLAKHWHGYGYIYPFLELGLGLLYLLAWVPVWTYTITIIVMGFSSLGVIKSLANKQSITCACLGTALNVPMSSITLLEDLVMVVMAVMMLVWLSY